MQGGNNEEENTRTKRIKLNYTIRENVLQPHLTLSNKNHNKRVSERCVLCAASSQLIRKLSHSTVKWIGMEDETTPRQVGSGWGNRVNQHEDTIKGQSEMQYNCSKNKNIWKR